MAGVVLAAAGSHRGGGDLARLAAEFLLIHGALIFCLGAVVAMGLRPALPFLLAASALALGTSMFSADLGALALMDVHPVPFAAPVGGSLLIVGWLILTVGAALQFRTSASDRSDRNI